MGKTGSSELRSTHIAILEVMRTEINKQEKKKGYDIQGKTMTIGARSNYYVSLERINTVFSICVKEKFKQKKVNVHIHCFAGGPTGPIQEGSVGTSSGGNHGSSGTATTASPVVVTTPKATSTPGITFHENCVRFYKIHFIRTSLDYFVLSSRFFLDI